MIKLKFNITGGDCNAVKWTGKNKIELQQFGVTGTAAGRQTKIDCTGKLFVKRGKTFVPVPVGDYVVQHGTVYTHETEQDIEAYYTKVED